MRNDIPAALVCVSPSFGDEELHLRPQLFAYPFLVMHVSHPIHGCLLLQSSSLLLGNVLLHPPAPRLATVTYILTLLMT